METLMLFVNEHPYISFLILLFIIYMLVKVFSNSGRRRGRGSTYGSYGGYDSYDCDSGDSGDCGGD